MKTLTTDKNIEFQIIEEMETFGKMADTFKTLLCVKLPKGKKQFLAGTYENGTTTIICDMP
mgnify:CR=1 FL=1